MAKIQIPFELVPLSAVPVKPPKIDPPENPSGSKWDAALNALERNPDKAVRIREPSKKRRGDLKSTLKLRAVNLQVSVEVRDDGAEYVYAFLANRVGRYDSLEPN